MREPSNQTAPTLSAHHKTDMASRESIETDIQYLLVNEPTSKTAQEFLKKCWDNHQWIGCSCSQDAFLSIRKTTNYYCLVRLTSRGSHKDDCPFSEENMPIYKQKLAERINTNALSFHRAKPKRNNNKPLQSPISIMGQQAEASMLARFMFTLYDDAGLNSVPLSGKRPDLKHQYHMIRQIASRYNIAGHTGNNVIFTHPGQIDKAKNYLIESKWPAGAIPQVLLFFTVDQIDGRNMLMNIGDKKYQLTSQSKIEYFYDNASPPFNVLMTLAQRPDSTHQEVLRAAALPVFEKSWLLPVKNKLVRKFIKSMLAMSKDYETYDAKIVIPFFPKHFTEISVRPDFSIERDGNTLAVFYFLSERDDNYAARTGEINFLKSHGIKVSVFDMDEVRSNPERDAWKEASNFFNAYIKDFKLAQKPKELIVAEQDAADEPINLLG